MPNPDGDSPAAYDAAAYDAKVLRAFLRDGRLVSIPAQEKKRLAILRYVMERTFAQDREYHEDVATLRRHLVTSGLMTRAGGVYRRAG